MTLTKLFTQKGMASRLLMAVVFILAIAVSSQLTPVYNSAACKNDSELLKATRGILVITVLLFVLPLTFFMCVMGCSEPVGMSKYFYMLVLFALSVSLLVYGSKLEKISKKINCKDGLKLSKTCSVIGGLLMGVVAIFTVIAVKFTIERVSIFHPDIKDKTSAQLRRAREQLKRAAKKTSAQLKRAVKKSRDHLKRVTKKAHGKLRDAFIDRKAEEQMKRKEFDMDEQ